jgi:hypothetical protein
MAIPRRPYSAQRSPVCKRHESARLDRACMPNYLLQTPTAISTFDAPNFRWVAGGPPGDLVGIKVANTGTGRVEIHVLSRESHYQTFRLQVGTPISLADAPNFRWIGGGGDVIGIKVTNAESGRVEIHSLDGSEQYQSFSIQKPTAIGAADGAQNFAPTVLRAAAPRPGGRRAGRRRLAGAAGDQSHGGR